MRIALNEATQERLLEVMQARGVTNPTHMVNILISEAHRTATTVSFPTVEESNDSASYISQYSKAA